MKQTGKCAEGTHRAGIQDAWKVCFGRSAPKYLSASFMQRTLEWEQQAKVSGGLPTEVKRALRDIARGKRQVSRKAAAGTQLVREWNGRTYQVEVLEQGFRMEGRDFTSLSAVAKKITGAHWSGPRFFGLTGGKYA